MAESSTWGALWGGKHLLVSEIGAWPWGTWQSLCCPSKEMCREYSKRVQDIPSIPISQQDVVLPDPPKGDQGSQLNMLRLLKWIIWNQVDTSLCLCPAGGRSWGGEQNSKETHSRCHQPAEGKRKKGKLLWLRLLWTQSECPDKGIHWKVKISE